MPTFSAQFMGRFAYVFAPDGNVSVLAPKMSGATVPPFKPHPASLTIPARFVISGDEHALRVVTIPGKEAASWMVWDLEGVDVEFGDYVGGGVKHEFPPLGEDRPGMPDLLDLPPGGADRASVDARMVARVAPKDALTTRINIGGGMLRPVPTVRLTPGIDQYAFKLYDDRTPVGPKEPVRVFVDAVEWDAETVQPDRDTPTGLTIVLHNFDGSNDRKIVCRPDKALTIGISHTCNCSSQVDRDLEFAAYYNLLVQPPDVADRKIPVLKPPTDNTFICGAGPDCQGIVMAKLK